MNILIPIDVTEASLGAGTTIAEPSTNETAWSGSSVAYAVGDIRIRSTTHRKYKCAVAHTSAASPLPENDPTRWVDTGPTDRHAPFDVYTSTAAKATTSLTYVVSPGFFNSIALYGLTGAAYAVTVRDAPGGAIIFQRSGDLSEAPLGWYEYLFNKPKTISKLLFTDVPIRPTSELTVTISASVGADVGLGMLVMGDFVPLASGWGGTQYGASAEPITYSYIKLEDDGTTNIKRRHAATNIRAKVLMPRDQADAALGYIQSVLDVPCVWVATETPGYSGLNTFGIGSASVSYDSFGHASIDVLVKGLI